MKKEPILVIMAAGMGSRFGGLKQTNPDKLQREIIRIFHFMMHSWRDSRKPFL